ncbi:isomerase [Pseudohalioglobus lutimaris]|uniref:Isomerase n=2 Tax=Pseudohalioglobus lutimaris TaxID=1737061 RepID=A0A2N5WYR3_9GAMM|nr:isomerase [Pseudohalioglobus lutimaris]
MKMPIYQVDAFTTELFRGNPAAVMPLDAWPEDHLLQAVASENNLSETAYLVAGEGGYALRWFTPEVEVDLCGHATLASAHVLYQHLGYADDSVRFNTRSGDLQVRRENGAYTLDFPAYALAEMEVDAAVCAALGAVPQQALQVEGAAKRLYVFESEEEVAALSPDFAALLAACDQSIIVTAPGTSVDFVSRFFGPAVGVDEDPVTGSAHCALVPYWAGRLGRPRLDARQISRRGGELQCELKAGRVLMTGGCVTFMQGEVHWPR